MTPPPRPDGDALAGARWPAGAVTLALLALGVLVRLALLRAPRLWYDEATTGLLGLAVLRGVLPVYFFGQPFMGALDGYLAAPLYWAFGASAFTLELATVLLALAGLALTVRLACDAFGPRAAAWTALVLAAPPDYLLFWSHEGRGHYVLTWTLGALALLLALRAPAAAGRRATLLLALLGVVLGVAFWTNFLSVVYLPAVAVLLLRRGVRPVLLRGLVLLPAFALGSLPHWLYGIPHGTAWPAAGGWIGFEAMRQHAQHFAATAWPIVAGVPARLRGTGGGAAFAAALGAFYLAAAVAAARRGDRAPARATGLALGALVVATLGVTIGTRYGRGLNDNDPRYLLPLYTALPVLAGAGLARCRPRSLAALGAAALVLVHGAGALQGSFRPGAGAAPGGAPAGLRDAVAPLERAGLTRLYDSDPSSRILTFLSAERVVFSNPYEEILPEYARAVDGAPAPGWSMPQRSRVLEANFAALGATFEFHPVPGLGGVYANFALAVPAVRPLDPGALRVRTSERPDLAARMTDRLAGTLWSTGRPQRGGEWVQVDLGAVVPVALVRWLPGTYQEVPRALRLEASLDGETWRSFVDLREYVGPLYWSAGRPMARVRSSRVELRVPPTLARHLRVTQTGRDPRWAWTIRELYVYAADGAPGPAPDVDGATLARALRAAGVTRLYADHGWSSRVALADPGLQVLPANLQLDRYGFRGSATWLFPPVRWEPGSGALVEPGDATIFEAAAHAGGLAIARRDVGGLTLFVHPGPAPSGPPQRASARDPVQVTASRAPERARLAVDGDPATRWATAGPRAAGDWVGVDLPAARVLRGLRLEAANPSDLPLGLRVEASPDGLHWEPLPARVQPEHRFRWAGFTLVGDGVTAVRLAFAPVTVRALRVVLAESDPVFDWSIHELTLEADAGPE